MPDDSLRIFQERITKTPGGFRELFDSENDHSYGVLEPVNPGLKILREFRNRFNVPASDFRFLQPIIEEWKRHPEDWYASINPYAPTGTITHEAGHGVIDKIVKSLTARQRRGPLRPFLTDPTGEALTRSIADPLEDDPKTNQINFDMLVKVLSEGLPAQQELLTKVIRLRQQGLAAKPSANQFYNYSPGSLNRLPPYPPAR